MAFGPNIEASTGDITAVTVSSPIAGGAGSGSAALSFDTDVAWVINHSTGVWTAYTTIAAALTAATNGMTVCVGPGTRNERLTLKNGVNMYFFPGATISVTGAGTTPVFSDNGSPVTCTIGGHGNFTYSGSSIPTNVAGIVSCTAASTITLYANAITVTKAGAGVFGGGTASTATLKASVRSITAATVGCLGIDMGAFSALYLDVTDDMLVDGDCFTDTGSAGSVAFIRVGTTITSNNASALAPSATSTVGFYITTQQIYGNTSGINANGGSSVHITADVVGGNNGPGMIVNTATAHVDVRSFSGTTFGVDVQANGTLTFTNTSYLTAIAAGGVALKIATDLVTARANLILVSEATATNSVEAAAAQTMKVYGSVLGNKAKDADVTIQVGTSIFSDSNIA